MFILPGVILDILIYKKRHLAKWLCYYELTSILIQGFVPFNYGDFMNLTLLQSLLQIYITMACDIGPNAIACVATMLIIYFC